MEYGFKLDPGETITKVVHRHFLAFVPTLALGLLLFLAATGMAYLEGRFPGVTPFPPIFMLTIIVVLYVMSASIIFVGWYVFRRNLLIFTNAHLVIIDQLSLFNRRVSQLSFLRVEDVTGRRAGLIHTLFNYGDVQVQSAGEQEKFIFRNAPHPEALADEALEIHETCMRKEGVKEAGYDPELEYARAKASAGKHSNNTEA
jgi:uncharacterized membrane protein YdbT with pleckstrin-like domain